MTVREYIGARYVPLFMGDWDNSNTYEPLSIVQYQGNSYTSRQYVPTGIEITNETYWANTGNYNAQIEAYRQEVEAYDNRIEAIEDALPISEFDSTNTVDARFDTIEANGWVTNARIADGSVLSAKIGTGSVITSKIGDGNVTDLKLDPAGLKSFVSNKKHIAVYCGNSFALGTGATDGNAGIFNRTKHLFDEAYLFWDDGIGFDEYTGHGSTHTFNQMVENAKASADFNNNDVTEFIFISAMGDTRAVCENSNFVNLASTLNNVRTNFPNAQVYIYYAEITGTKTVQSSYSNRYAFAQLRTHLVFNFYAATYNYVYLGWRGWNINFDTTFTSADNYHPNNNGYITLSNFFIKAIRDKRTIYKTKSGSVQYGSYQTIHYRMDDPLHGVARMESVTAASNPSFTGNSTFSLAQFWNPTASDSDPCFYPVCFDHGVIFATKLDANQNNLYSAMKMNAVLSTASGNCLLNVTPMQNVSSDNVNVTTYAGMGFTLPINMWIDSSLAIS